MKANITLLPAATDLTRTVHRADSISYQLPRLIRCKRRGSILYASALGAHGNVWGLNLTQGPTIASDLYYPGDAAAHHKDAVVNFYSDTPNLLVTELNGRQSMPRAVWISPLVEPFPPLMEMQRTAGEVVETLAKYGIESWITTRGYIRPFVLRMLSANFERLKINLPITTLDRKLQRLLEPLTASPSLRLRQIKKLCALGNGVQVALEPLIPGLTDSRTNLCPLLESLADFGVRHVTTSYMILRSLNLDRLTNQSNRPWGESVVSAYQSGPVLHSPGLPPARYLPKSHRQRGYAALMALAAGYGITVSVSGLANPDFQPARKSHSCNSLRQQLLAGF